MGFFSRQEKKEWLSKNEQQEVVEAIKAAEKDTSGEIRVFIEATCNKDVTARAQEIFLKLKMDATALRNGVLVYLSYDDHHFCLLGDEGIYTKTGGSAYWEKEVKVALAHFKNGDYVKGLTTVITDIGKSLTEFYPLEPNTDKNELPDEIVFG